MRRQRVVAPNGWPSDPTHTFALWLMPQGAAGSQSRAYVTAHPVYRDIGVHSRFATRLDLPGTYASRAAAAPAAYAAAARFVRGKYAADHLEESKVVRGFLLSAHARFRIDCHEWEPVLTIRREGAKNAGPVQTFDGADSPFVRTTFPSAAAAISYALAYGERVVLGMIRGLRV